MTRTSLRRLLLAVPLLAVLLTAAAIVVLRSSWFERALRHEIVARIDASTGGRAEIGAFTFDWRGLRIAISGFVLHGTEPPGQPPLAAVRRIDLTLRIFGARFHPVDLAYLGLTAPAVNVLVYPDGSTNIPGPRARRSPSSTLATLVDLAVGRFDITQGSFDFAGRRGVFSAHGRGLRALLAYDSRARAYVGRLAVHPLRLALAGGQPLEADLDLPLSLARDSIRLSHATLRTPASSVTLDAEVHHLVSPVVAADIRASLSLDELGRALALPLHPQSNAARLEADVSLHTGGPSLTIRSARLRLGRSFLDASGAPLAFHSQLALDEIGHLVSLPLSLAGSASLDGTLTLDAHAPLTVLARSTGRLSVRGLSLARGDLGIRDALLDSAFQLDSSALSFTALRLSTLGGDFTGGASLDKSLIWDLSGQLSRFSLPTLVALLTARPFGYSGAVSGSIHARGDARHRGLRSLIAEASLDIAAEGPRAAGIPVSGHVRAVYSGRDDSLVLTPSYLALPHSRLDLAGLSGTALHVHLVTSGLDDFLPAIAFATRRPPAPLPVRLSPGGSAGILADVTGSLDDARVAGRVSANHFSLEGHPLDSISATLAASPSAVSLRNGVLTAPGLRAGFDSTVGLSDWQAQPGSSFTLALTIPRAPAPALAALAGQPDFPLTGTASAQLRLDGTLDAPRGQATFSLSAGEISGQRFDRLDAGLSLAGHRIQLDSASLSYGSARLSATGSFDHSPGDWQAGRLTAHIAGNAIPAARLALLSANPPGLSSGTLALDASASADVAHTPAGPSFSLRSLDARLEARDLTGPAGPLGDLTAMARTTAQTVDFALDSNLAGASLHAHGATRLIPSYPTRGAATLSGVPLRKLFALAARTAPLDGELSAEASFDGSLDDPRGQIDFRLLRGTLAGERFDSLQGLLRLSNQAVTLDNARLTAPAGTVSFSGSFTHPPFQWSSGQFELRVSAPSMDLAHLGQAQLVQPGSAGAVSLDAGLAGSLAPAQPGPRLRLTGFEGSAKAANLAIGSQSFGGGDLVAHTVNGAVTLQLDSNFAGSSIHGSGHMRLDGDNALDASVQFSRITYSGLRTLLGLSQNIRPDFDLLTEGTLAVHGPAFNPDALQATLRLDRLEASASLRGAAATPGRVTLFANDGPLEATLEHSSIRILPARLAGRNVKIDVSGSVPLDAEAPLRLEIAADTGLAVLQEIDRDVYSGGRVALKASLRGSRTHPFANGQVTLDDASLNLADIPNGISHANGVILLNGLTASVRNLTGETGGGKFSVTGSADLTGGVARFALKTSADRVRVRYAGASVTSNATLSLNGITGRSSLTGDVVVNRLAFSQESDLGSLLALTSTPATTQSAPNPFLSAIRLDVHVRTAPDVRFQTSYTQRLDADANLNLRGTLDRPGLIGRINVTQGQVVFFGNQYTVNQGAISFYNTQKIEPVLNISLQTQAQGVDVVLGVTGPVDDMKLSYRSDPPLQFSEIVGLLALGATPSSDATIAAHQPPAPQQSFGQMGESAIVGQALATPLANRLQRVFGISQIRIDPAFITGSAIPLARVTLQQQVSSNILFTYTTDLSAGNSQLIRVEWAITPRYSAVATRDENGILSFDLFYKKQFR